MSWFRHSVMALAAGGLAAGLGHYLDLMIEASDEKPLLSS